MSLKWIIKFVVDDQLVKLFNSEDVYFQKIKIFLSFEDGNCNRLWIIICFNRWRGDYDGMIQLWFPSNYVQEIETADNGKATPLGSMQEGSIDLTGVSVGKGYSTFISRPTKLCFFLWIVFGTINYQHVILCHIIWVGPFTYSWRDGFLLTLRTLMSTTVYILRFYWHLYNQLLKVKCASNFETLIFVGPYISQLKFFLVTWSCGLR